MLKRNFLNYPRLLSIILALGMVVVVFIFVYYNQTIIFRLKTDAVRVSGAYARLWQYAASEATSGAEINYIFEEIIKKANFPIIVTSPKGVPMYWTVDIPPNDTSAEAMRKLDNYIKDMDKNYKAVPIYFGPEKTVVHYLHYGDSKLIQQLQYIPYIELLVVGILVMVGFIGFRNIKRSEQRSIWVGMAKETAHQLGTPLSSLMGWVELLKLKFKSQDFNLPNENTRVHFDDIVGRMKSDLKRLDRVAIRFGQIGSIPELELRNVNQPIAEVVSYFRLRLPDGGKGVEIIEQYGDIPDININMELIAWVVENLIKNSLEAIDPRKGEIVIKTECNNSKIIISIADNGRGISSKDQRRIFAPGFTTRNRGWGLGLTLAQRIVEEYHQGRIWLEKSEPSVKTEFKIELPV